MVGYDDVEAFADRLVKLLSDDELLQKMSDGAYGLSDRYSEANVWKAWEALLNDAKSKTFSYIPAITQGIGDQEIHK